MQMGMSDSIGPRSLASGNIGGILPPFDGTKLMDKADEEVDRILTE